MQEQNQSWLERVADASQDTFNNTAKKIEGAASVLMMIGVTCSIIGGLILIVNGVNSYRGGNALVISGILIAIFGSLASYINSLLLCGFAEHIKQLTRIANNTQKDAGQHTPLSNPLTETQAAQNRLAQLDDLYRQSAISDEDYQRLITEVENGEL